MAKKAKDEVVETKQTSDKKVPAEDAAKAVETKTDSPEEKAAARADVPETHLHDDSQNRAPKNEFEKVNQVETDKVRKEAQKVSDMTSEDKEKKLDTPQEAAKKDAVATAETNQGSEIAKAISEGLAKAKDDNFVITSDPNVVPRNSLVKNKDGKIFIRDNETGLLSELQLESVEEKEASIQDQEVEEL